MKCNACGGKLNIVDILLLRFHFWLRITKEEKYFKIKIPLCGICAKVIGARDIKWALYNSVVISVANAVASLQYPASTIALNVKILECHASIKLYALLVSKTQLGIAR